MKQKKITKKKKNQQENIKWSAFNDGWNMYAIFLARTIEIKFVILMQEYHKIAGLADPWNCMHISSTLQL